jgi:hypothetical protein
MAQIHPYAMNDVWTDHDDDNNNNGGSSTGNGGDMQNAG